jgi:tripeptidyl-peptidase II
MTLHRSFSLSSFVRFWIPATLLALAIAGPSLAERGVEKGSGGPDSGEAARLDPKLGLMPKVETGALEFIEENPEYNGRGTVVAIFDTGVDPGAIGLQTTPDGRPKVIDIVDATGSGDVDMSKAVLVKDGKATGVTGRELRIPARWKVKGALRVGAKLGYELYPAELVPRIKAHRKKKFMEQQVKLENDLRTQVQFRKGTDKAEYQKRLDAAIAAGKKYSDPGPIYDCVVYHDGKVWRGAVDTDEDGDFNDEKAMTNFRVDQEWDTFDEVSLLNFGLNIYEGGKVLSIVADAHPHGTHVAGITAGYYPDQPEWNGVAPGAQIVSCKIGDTYIDGMETGKALIRAVKTVIENDCDLINMSFGEPTKSPNRGLIIRYFQEVVEKEGVIFCASAGNAGPALSTVGAPGGTSTSLIGIGAYVSPEMAKAQYALREGGRNLPYTWTSRGPTFDGDIGVNLFAPGGAIAPVPQWTLEKSMQMNGTSMASPNLCGNLALILSGLKEKKIPYNPESVKRACENTAKWIDDASPWAQGAGLIQTPAAFRALVRDKNRNSERVRLEPAVGSKRGIYLRDIADAGQNAEPREFRCTVAPKFHPDATSREKVGYRIRLKLESTADWVKCGEQITIASVPERFSVLVDPTAVEPGAHFAEVRGIDPEHPERGPLFRLPVTLLKLIPEGDEDSKELSLNNGWAEEKFESTPGDIQRRFYPVPAGATWADVRFHVESGDDGGRSRMFMVHAVQSVPGWTNRDGESNNFLALEPGVEKVISFPVQPGRGMEIAFAQYWSSLGSCNLHYDLTFHGIVPDQRAVNLQPGVVASQVEVATTLQFENLAPEAKLTKYRRLVKPDSASVNLLAADRDGFSGNRRFHELVLTYKINGAGAVTPYFPKVDDLLYDSEYGGFLIAVFDPNGKRIGTDDIWPHPISIGKGEHTLKLWIRHDDRSKLDALKSMPMAQERSLGSPVTLSIYPTLIAAQNGGPTFRGHWLNPDQKERFFVGNISSAPGGTIAGDVLLGSITYGKKDTHGGSGQLPGGFPLSAVVSSTQAATAKPAASTSGGWTWTDPAPAKTDEEKLAKAVRKAKLDYLKGLSIDSNRSAFYKLAGELKKDGAELPVLVLTLEKLDDAEKRKTRLSSVVSAADAVLAQIDAATIEAGLGLRPADGDGAAAKKKKEAEKLKGLLVDTLYRKGRALGYMELPEVLERWPIKDQKAHDEAFEANYKELARWDDATSEKHFLLHIRRAAKKKQLGESLKWLNKYAGGPASNYWHLEKRRKFYKALGWRHLEANAQGLLRAHFPNGKP